MTVRLYLLLFRPSQRSASANRGHSAPLSPYNPRTAERCGLLSASESAADAKLVDMDSPRQPPWQSNEPLGSTLYHLRMSSVLYCHAKLSAPWGIDMPPMPDCIIFHIMIAGECTVAIGDQQWLLTPGCFALVPHGSGHVISSDDEAQVMNLFDLNLERLSEHYEQLHHGGGGTETAMLCGAVRLTDPVAQRLVKLLPPCLHTNAWQVRHAEWMDQTLRMLMREAAELRAGGEVILTRLADVLIIAAIREWLTDNPSDGRGWLGALQDPELGPVLAAIHAQPETAWTVSQLAELAAMSRSSFAARFNDVLGQTPADYVRQWKVHQAASWLRSGECTVTQAGRRLGYESEAAFSRTFKRIMGCSAQSIKRPAAY